MNYSRDDRLKALELATARNKILKQSIQPDGLEFASSGHLRHRSDIRLSIKGRVYAAALKSVRLHGSETGLWRAKSIEDFPCLNAVVFVVMTRYGGRILSVIHNLGVRY